LQNHKNQKPSLLCSGWLMHHVAAVSPHSTEMGNNTIKTHVVLHPRICWIAVSLSMWAQHTQSWHIFHLPKWMEHPKACYALHKASITS
jgi:hypothetical protein